MNAFRSVFFFARPFFCSYLHGSCIRSLTHSFDRSHFAHTAIFIHLAGSQFTFVRVMFCKQYSAVLFFFASTCLNELSPQIIISIVVCMKWCEELKRNVKYIARWKGNVINKCIWTHTHIYTYSSNENVEAPNCIIIVIFHHHEG